MSGHPVAGVDYPRTVLEFQEWFATDRACLDYLAGLRWPDGFVCPKCATVDRAWRTADGLWMCSECGRQTSVTAGTIFDKTRSPLRMWFSAAWYITSQKSGVSAQGLQRVLGLRSYETAWAWMHKFRRAMVVPGRDLLRGTVELDETFVGGISRGNQGRSSTKIGVMIAAEMVTARRLGRIRLEPWLEGTLHYGASADHLAYYLDEFTFRFNRRASRSRGLLFYRLLQQTVQTAPAPLQTLFANKPYEDSEGDLT